MSDLLSIGSTGVRAYQTAMNVVGENIANASTKGYVRRDAKLTEAMGAAGRNILINNYQIGQGVNAFTVERAWDELKAAEVRTSSAEAGRTNSTIVWLDRIEKALSGINIGASLTRFFNAAEGVAADPTGTAPRTAMLDAADGVASAFTATTTNLRTIDMDLRASAAQAIDQLNIFANGLAEANIGLVRSRPGSNEQAQLADQRDRMIDEISKLASISVSTDDRGIATVRLNDANGPILVQGPLTKAMEVSFNASGQMALTHDRYSAPAPVSLRGGTIAGFAEASARLHDLRANVATLASDLATAINQVQAGGRDLDGQPGAALFDASAADGSLSVNALGTRQIAAARPWTVTAAPGNGGATTALAAGTAPSGTPLASTRITVSGGTLTAIDPVTNSIIGTASFTPGTPITLAGLSLTLTGAPTDGDSFTVAATGAGSRDNGNLATLATLRRSGRFEGQANDMTTANASALSAKRQVADAQAAILDGAVAARDAVSGVNLDQEAVDLMRFQQAYQASSRIIQVARDTFDSLLAAVR